MSSKMREITIKDKEREVEARAKTLGYPYINLVGFVISAETLGMLEEKEIVRK